MKDDVYSFFPPKPTIEPSPESCELTSHLHAELILIFHNVANNLI